MICSHCRDVVLDIARGIAHVEEAMALHHASGCADCNQYLQQQRELTVGMRALAAEADDVPSNAMEQRLLAAFDAKAAPAAERPAAPRWPASRWLKIAAAILLATSAIAAWQWRTRDPAAGAARAADRGRPTASTAAGAPVVGRGFSLAGRRGSGRAGAPDRAEGVGTTRAMAEPPPLVESRPIRGAAARQAQFTGRAATAGTRIVQAAQFFALPSAAMLPPFERGEIVRVQVTLASLANLGFAVQPDAIDNTPVNADLLVGQDGRPRAIRLITDTQDSRSRR